VQRLGEYRYESDAGTPGAESMDERWRQERFWRSLGKRIRSGTKIRQPPPHGDTFGKWLYR